MVARMEQEELELI